MADKEIDEHNRSLDKAIAKTLAYRLQQKELVKDLANTEAEQKKAVESLDKATAKYGAGSTQVQKLEERLEALKNRESALEVQLKSMSTALEGQQGALEGTGTAAEETGKGLSGLADKFMGLSKFVTKAMTLENGKRFLEATIGSLSEFEQYETSFAVLLGDVGKAKGLLAELEKFSGSAPLSVDDLAGPAQTLLRFGVSLEDVLETLGMLGDVSQGSGEKLASLAQGFGQVQSDGKLTEGALSTLASGGFDLLRVMAEGAGKSVTDMKQQMEDGAISAAMVTQAFQDATSEGGQFFGALEAQSGTLDGTFKTLQNKLGQAARDVGEGAFQETKSALSEITAEIDRMSESGELEAIVKSWGAAFSMIAKAAFGATKFLLENKEIVGGLIAVYGAFMVVQNAALVLSEYAAVVKTTTTAQATLNAVTKANPYVLLAGVLLSVVGAVVSFSKATNEASEEVQNLNQKMENLKSDQIESARNRIAELDVAANETLDRIQSLYDGYIRTGEGSDELQRTISNLNDTLGYEAASFNMATGELDLNTEAIRSNIQALKARALQEAAEEEMLAAARQKLAANTKADELRAKKEETEKVHQQIQKMLDDAIGSFDLLGIKQAGDLLNGGPLSGFSKGSAGALRDLNKQISEQEQIAQNAEQYMNRLAEKTKEYAENASKAAIDTEQFSFDLNAANQAISDQYDAFQEHHKNLKALEEAEAEYNETGKLSVETLESLSAQYSTLRPYIDNYLLGLIDEKELMAQFPAIYGEDEEAQRSLLQAKAALSENYYKTNILSNAGLYNHFRENYGIDLKNFTSLAQAKGELEAKLIGSLSMAWGKYYSEVGGSASKTMAAMQQQLEGMLRNGDSAATDPMYDEKIRDLQNMIEAMKALEDLKNIDIAVDFENFNLDLKPEEKSGASNASSSSKDKETAWQEKKRAELEHSLKMDKITEAVYLQELLKLKDSYYNKDIEQYQKYEQEIHSLQKNAKEKEEQLKQKTFDSQLQIAADYYKEQQDAAEQSYTAAAKRISEEYKEMSDAVKARYDGEMKAIQDVIDQIDLQIQAKRKAREEEKLDDSLSFAQKRMQTLKTQITFARTPEERGELEKELKRQQEELSDLTIQKEVNALEAQKGEQEGLLTEKQEELEAELEGLAALQEQKLKDAEEIRDKALENIKLASDAFSKALYASFEYINEETLAIGGRFATVTNEALKAGFAEVETKSKSVIAEMIAQVQYAISEMEEAISKVSLQAEKGREDAEKRPTSTYSDSRSARIVNNNYNGLTAGQVDAIMTRQVERVLYGRR